MGASLAARRFLRHSLARGIRSSTCRWRGRAPAIDKLACNLWRKRSAESAKNRQRRSHMYYHYIEV